MLSQLVETKTAIESPGKHWIAVRKTGCTKVLSVHLMIALSASEGNYRDRDVIRILSSPT